MANRRSLVDRLLRRKADKSFNNLRAGDRFRIYCDRRFCGSYIRAIVINESTMECYDSKTKRYIDKRNQVMTCYKHFKKRRPPIKNN